MKVKVLYAGILSLSFCGLLISCNSSANGKIQEKKIFQFAESQTKNMLGTLDESKAAFPRSIKEDGTLRTVGVKDWTSGFFPGSLWYLYEYSKDNFWEGKAELWTSKLESLQYFTGHHDVGFMMYCSYGNGYRLTGNESYKGILINTAKSLSTRYFPDAGVIRSWNPKVSKKGVQWNCPVIIDNMMNLELLFFASRVSGDDSFRKIAISHAEKTMKNHIRADYSTYHVVDYDTITGQVMDRDTWQGYATNSTWSRGQAWGIYGFTMTYRETKDPRFLETARKLADFFINNPNLPEDKIPNWDFNVNQAGYKPDFEYSAVKYTPVPRDVSAAAITASALLELSTYLGEEGKAYFDTAEKMLKSMSSKEYTAELGTNGNFILKHFVGNLSAGDAKGEIDKPSVYADYYYLEGLTRYKRLKEGKPVVLQ